MPFGSDERHVADDGKAFFDIAPDTRRAFVVKTPRGEIRSEKTGGKLNVTAYQADSATRIIPIDQPINVRLIANDQMLTLH
ncbi:hypothetical protein ACFOET_16035 [Parapedobacter deserti]|uniref:Uncharacterized protein n=1 Tax=Parapedobacter deserti TaxID=1912957 RepID=A0ABV7JQA5_9SPHI